MPGFFSLELVYDPKAPVAYPSGGAFQYLGITLPSTLAMVAYKTDDAVRREKKGVFLRYHTHYIRGLGREAEGGEGPGRRRGNASMLWYENGDVRGEGGEVHA